MSKKIKLEDNIIKVDKFLRQLNGEGANNDLFSNWPVIIRGYGFNNSKTYEYVYPYPFFDNLADKISVYISFNSKSERRLFNKMIINRLMNDEIDIFTYHFGMYLLYGKDLFFLQKEDLSEQAIGKRRFEFIQSLPKSSFCNTEDFISEVWRQQIRKREIGSDEYSYNPSMENIRILFKPGQFDCFTGKLYDSNEISWVEPLSGERDLKCNTYTEETDPIKTSSLPEGWVQGKIYWGSDGGGNRHFVKDTPIHCGTEIMVKFGKGWVVGRYECDLINKGDIQIWAGNDVFFINEGHEVRVRKC